MAEIFFDTSTALAANGIFTAGVAGNGGAAGAGIGNGQARDASRHPDANRFGAIAHSDQAGTLYLDGTFDLTNGPWRQCASVAVTAGTPVDIDVPVRFRYMRCRYVNGGTATGAGNFSVHSSFRS